MYFKALRKLVAQLKKIRYTRDDSRGWYIKKAISESEAIIGHGTIDYRRTMVVLICLIEADLI